MSTAPILPISLSPHICVLQSQDLAGLLEVSSLPPMPQILQSFTPLSQITTRTTTLTPVIHPSFALRFSDLAEIEEGCREPEEQRAERTIDWIGARIAKKSTKWMEEWEDSGAAARERDGDPTLRTPWWEELRRCVEGDRIPSRVEGWNHPVAIIVAVSTLAPNPLQALAQLHSRPPDVPHWVDSSNLRYTLIVHPSDSRLSDEEAGALFNAAKKQYGLHTFLLPLSFSRDGQRPVPVPMYPCLPLPPRESGAVTPDPGFLEAPAELEHVMLLSETDIQRIAKFVRELATMSLLPWMEKCVLEWNETFSSTRRLPSRLFTSTRRLFGSSNPSSPVAGQPPVSSSITRTHSVSGSISSGPGFANWATTFPQQRRLAEFATILGDLKLAVPVWESTQRDSKGGSEILPLLLSPTPATVLHVQHALSAITAPGAELTAAGQVRALTYAMRWATGTNPRDLLSDILGGERWLVWAAASAEEPPLALLLAHAAALSVRRWSTRRAALLYLLAAKRLEKFGAGVKPLTMHFLRRAHHLYLQPHDKCLSPSFWDADGLEPTRVPGFDSIVPGIEYALGRLHYTTGDAVGAVKFFLSVLGASQKDGVRAADGLDVTKAAMDKNTLDDLRIAYQHLKATRGDNFDPSELKLKLPITLCDRTKTALRLPGDSVGGDTSIWEAREESWRAFWQPRGSEKFMRTSTAVVNEVFWVDLVLHNPLNVEIDLSNLTVIVQDSLESTSSISSDLILVETFAEVTLGPKETVTVPLSMRASASGIYFVKAVSYDFLSLFPSVENLSRRGRRLQDTPIQRQSKVYAPDVFLEANVKDASQRLAVTFVDDGRLILSHGEYREMRLWLSNAGSKPITDIWLLSGPEDEFCLASEEAKSEVTAPYTVSSTNSLISTPPHCLSEISLQPGEDASFSIILHADRVGDRELCFLFVYRERDTAPTFFSTRVTRSFEVESLMNVELRSQPSFLPESIFQIQASISNASNQGSHFVLTQLSAISSFWTITGLTVPTDVEVLPGQVLQVLLSVRRGESGQLSTGADVFRFVSDKVQAVLLGHSIDDTNPPAVELTCSQIGTSSHSFTDSWMRALLHLSRRNATASHVSQQHPHIPAHLYPRIFPLYHPHGLDVILHWELPSEGRSGFILIPGPALGATHGALDTTIQEVEQMKVKRIMYAETQRERSSILEAIRSCEWNAEMNPVVATVQDLAVIEHDFAAEVAESCLVPVTFTLRNFSLTHSARYTLKLAPPDRALLHGPLDLSPPIWTGRLTHRGILKPLERAMVRAELHVSRPDTYLLEGWTLEVEVSSSSAAGENSATQWQTARTYQDTSVVSHQARVTVVDIS